MKNSTKWIIAIVCLLVVIGVVLFIVIRNIEKEKTQFEFATIWQVGTADKEKMPPDFSKASDRVRMSRQGFVKGLSTHPGMENYEEVIISESSDPRAFENGIADLYANSNILLTIGGTTDEITMNASMEMNYFKIPILIPFADGDFSSDDSAQPYSIRMTPTAQKYAEYFNGLFSSNLFTYINNVIFMDRSIPEYAINVAVFFLDNYNGHNTAVNITQVIMENGYNVDVFSPYPSLPELQYMIQSMWLNDPERMNEIDVVLIIGEDGESMAGMSGINKMWKDRNLEPLFYLVGFLPYSVEEDIFNARNIFAIQQALDFSHCPAEIVNRSEAMGYAAGYIVSSVMNTAQQKQPDEPGLLQLLFSSPDRRKSLHQDYLASYRENIRSILLEMDDNIPCFGRGDFDVNSDLNVNLELVRYTGIDQQESVGSGVLTDYLIDKIRHEYNLFESE